MKQLFRFFLFVSILFITGLQQRHSFSVPEFKTGYHKALSPQQRHLSNIKFTPVKPVRDLRVFQLVEDEEDNISSRAKRTSQYATSVNTFLSDSWIFIFQSRVKIQVDSTSYALKSNNLYIQLCTIRI